MDDIGKLKQEIKDSKSKMFAKGKDYMRDRILDAIRYDKKIIRITGGWITGGNTDGGFYFSEIIDDVVADLQDSGYHIFTPEKPGFWKRLTASTPMWKYLCIDMTKFKMPASAGPYRSRQTS